MLLNAVFFGSVFVGALLVELRLLPVSLWPGEAEGEVVGSLGLFLSVFLFNLIVSRFGVVMLPGVLFFGLPVVVLVVRGVLWGISLNWLLVGEFLWALPTVVLEGKVCRGLRLLDGRGKSVWDLCFGGVGSFGGGYCGGCDYYLFFVMFCRFCKRFIK